MNYVDSLDKCIKSLNTVWAARKDSLGKSQTWKDDSIMRHLQFTLETLFQMKLRLELKEEIKREGYEIRP